MTIVIIGGDAAGMSASSRIARKAKDAHVIVYEKTDTISYGACGLPFYIGGLNNDINLVKILSPEQARKTGVDLKLRHEVTAVDTEKKQVTVHDLEKDEVFIQDYDKLMIATGSRPVVPPVEGTDLGNVFVLKTIPEAEEIKATVLKDEIRKVAIIGGGFIGLELCEAMLSRGKETLLIEALPHVMNGYDEPFQEKMEEAMIRHGVKLHTGEMVQKLEGENGKVCRIHTDKGSYEVDVVVFAIGVRPNSELFPTVEKARNGAILTNTAMETSVPDVYAAGDVATLHNAVSGQTDYIALGSNANKQGRLAGDSMMGKKVSFDRTLGTSILRTLDFEMGKTGLSEREAKELGLDYGTAMVTQISHSPYYVAPKPFDLTAKIVYDKKTKVLLGAQIMGEREAAWRINVFACAVDRKMTTEELGMLDLAYSPSVTYIWDIIHVVANAAK